MNLGHCRVVKQLGHDGFQLRIACVVVSPKALNGRRPGLKVYIRQFPRGSVDHAPDLFRPVALDAPRYPHSKRFLSHGKPLK